jgi:hypothetical protein
MVVASASTNDGGGGSTGTLDDTAAMDSMWRCGGVLASGTTGAPCTQRQWHSRPRQHIAVDVNTKPSKCT